MSSPPALKTCSPKRNGAHARLAQWNQGTSKGPLRRRPRARRRRAAATDARQGHATHARRRSLARRRAAHLRQAEYYLANLPADTDLRTLAATIKARWVCEQAHQQLKEELGLDHFEGRSWRGLHRHALMAMIAYAFLQHRRLAAASGGKKNCLRAAPANAAGHTKSHRRSPGARPTLPMPALPPANPQIARIKSAKVVLGRGDKLREGGFPEARKSNSTLIFGGQRWIATHFGTINGSG